MKFKTALALSLVALSACASIPPGHEKEMAEFEAILAEKGLPSFHSGIQIMPRSQLGLPKEVLESGAREAKQQDELGYVDKNTPYASELLAMKDVAPINVKQYATNNNEQGTHLRKSARDLKLAFKFKGVESDGFLLRSNNNITVLGSAPQGAFNKESGGWSGAAQFFSVKNIGVCSYGVMNVKASGTSAQLAMEDVTYAIHDKATLTHIEGSKNSGFLYKVEWFDDNNFHELECASSQYSKKINHDVINLARIIDE